MTLTDEGRQAVQDSNRRRGMTCRKCGGFGTQRKRDGSEVGGMPGITYKECSSCGHAQPITKRPRREKLKE